MSLLDDPAAFAALVAPAVDRCAISVHPVVDQAALAALRGENRFAPAALTMFAGPLAAGPITAHEFAELTRYRHFGSPEKFVDGLVERGAITRNDDGDLVPTDAAVAMSKEIVTLQGTTISTLWAPLQRLLPTLRALSDRAVAAAVADGSVVAGLIARGWLPADATDALRVSTACVVLRMHRSDAHARAWREAGHSVESIRALAPGEERDAIERSTNTYAAAPWSVLTPDERLTLLAGLAALPGTGVPI